MCVVDLYLFLLMNFFFVFQKKKKKKKSQYPDNVNVEHFVKTIVFIRRSWSMALCTFSRSSNSLDDIDSA
jgi:hypothetical protein